MSEDAAPKAEAADDHPAVSHWRNMPRRTLTIALSILPIVALGNVAVLIYALGGINLSEKLKEPNLLGLVALLVFVPMIANSMRLALWARFLDLEFGFRKALKVITGTMVANSVTPSSTGGMPIKLLFLMGEGVDSRRSITLISFQAAEDTFITLAIVALCLGITGYAMFEFIGSDPLILARLDGTLRTASMIVLCVLLAIAAIAALIGAGVMGRRVREWTARLINRIKSHVAQIARDWASVFRQGKWLALINLGFSALQWLVRFSIAGLILLAFGVEWQPALFWLLQWLVQTISSIVPTPGGAGGAEAAFLLLFAPFVAIGVVVPAMSTWRLMHFYLPLVGAALTFFLLHRRDRARVKAAKDNEEIADPETGLPQPAE
ncbi:flippase-like domain-containing protein [Erythrobacter insulae]|uniref:Flippase-like domain-containing protein n=1 Tax=Erythrobacter insulae TaxID=2584124 RepID=A0A547P8P3_9SPHN|nr:lysylphosphatidylglycerol synthase transmembrane domain-containing protein [Erythrobacter insulae]TRD10496.1 flippase-like domain-containing protein [Erythrobacter insulae]